MGGGGGRGDRLVDGAATSAPLGDDVAGTERVGDGLFGPPGPRLAAAVEAVADPTLGSWPAGTLPFGASPEPWAQVIHAVVAGRRLSGWVLWAQLSMVARWLAAWRTAPPVSNTSDADRCEPAARLDAAAERGDRPGAPPTRRRARSVLAGSGRRHGLGPGRSRARARDRIIAAHGGPPRGGCRRPVPARPAP